MSTAASSVPAGFADTLAAKTATTSPLAAFRAGAAYIGRGLQSAARRLGLDRLFNWARGLLRPITSWFTRTFTGTDLVSAVAFALTTPQGRDLLTRRVPSFLYRMVKFPVRLVLKAIWWLPNKTTQGRKVSAWVSEHVARAEHWVADAQRTVDCWLTDRDSTLTYRWARVAAFGFLLLRISRYIPNPWLKGLFVIIGIGLPYGSVTMGKESYVDSIAYTAADTVMQALGEPPVGTPPASGKARVVDTHTVPAPSSNGSQTSPADAATKAPVPGPVGNPAGSRKQRRAGVRLAQRAGLQNPGAAGA